jgi:ribosomal protein S27AE
MVVWKLKKCPRCSGDVFIVRETNGWYEECLSCGHQRDISAIVSVIAGTTIRLRKRMQIPQKVTH